jgi:hypothetical protein
MVGRHLSGMQRKLRPSIKILPQKPRWRVRQAEEDEVDEALARSWDRERWFVRQVICAPMCNGPGDGLVPRLVRQSARIPQRAYGRLGIPCPPTGRKGPRT